MKSKVARRVNCKSHVQYCVQGPNYSNDLQGCQPKLGTY